MTVSVHCHRSARLMLVVFALLLVFVFAVDASAALTASFNGPREDVVSETVLSPDGRPDFNIKVSGLTSVPVEMEILSDTGGIWKVPFNGLNWVIALRNYSNGSGDLYFSQFPSNRFTLSVR